MADEQDDQQSSDDQSVDQTQQTTDDQSSSQSTPSDEQSSQASPSDTSSSVDATPSSSDQYAHKSETPTLDTSQASIGSMPEDALAFNDYDTNWIDSGSEVA